MWYSQTMHNYVNIFGDEAVDFPKHSRRFRVLGSRFLSLILALFGLWSPVNFWVRHIGVFDEKQSKFTDAL